MERVPINDPEKSLPGGSHKESTEKKRFLKSYGKKYVSGKNGKEERWCRRQNKYSIISVSCFFEQLIESLE